MAGCLSSSQDDLDLNKSSDILFGQEHDFCDVDMCDSSHVTTGFVDFGEGDSSQNSDDYHHDNDHHVGRVPTYTDNDSNRDNT
ncbi:hypothetical protein LSH36_1498g00015, partial [Paralvinella palmiformis]